MAADGSIVIEAVVDNKGAMANIKALEDAAKRAATSVEGIGKSAENALQKQVSAFSEMNQQVTTQQKNVKNLEKQLEEASGKTVETNTEKPEASIGKEVESQITVLEDAAKRAASSVESIGKHAETALQKQVSAFSELNQEVTALQNKVKSLEKQMEETSGKPVEVKAEEPEMPIGQEAERQITVLEDASKRAASSVQSIGKSVEVAFSKMNQQISAQQDKVRGLENQLKEMSGKTVETDAYKKINSEISKLEASLDKAIERQIRFMETGGKEGSNQFKRMEYDISMVSAKLDEARAKKTALESSGGATTAVDTSAIEKKLAAEREKLAMLNDQLSISYQKLNGKVDSYKKKMFSADSVAKSISKSTRQFGSRLRELISGALIFNIISSGLRSLTSHYGSALKSNNEFSSALARLKGALYTAFQPIYEAVLPGLITLMRILTAVIQVIGQFIAAITGKSYGQMAQNAKALNNQAKAIGGVGDAAKEASKDLYSFDELNRQSDASSSGGGGGGSTGEIAPDFDGYNAISDRLKEIAKYVLLIGAGFALWKIGSAIGGQLGTILSKIGLVMVALGGLLLMWDGIKDAWNNGVDWGNMAEMIGGLAIAAIALGVAFGPVAAGITLVVGGIALLITAFHDIMENGFNLQNTLLAIAGIFATGLGISLLTGSFIPALIAGIAGLLLAVTVATGHGEELIQGIKKTCQGFLDFFSGIFSGDMDKAISGLKTMFSGLGDIAKAVFSGLKDAIWAFLGWLNEKTGGAVNGVIGVINGMISAVVNGINGLFRLLSFNIDLPGGHSIGLSLPQFSAPQIPYLAQGAVIPPNAPFAAVLGDQRHGNNIEAPEDLIRKIVREEAAGGASNDEIIALLRELIEVVMGIKIGDETIGKAALRYTRRYNRAMGV